jgi:hypothetical protein
MSNTLSKPAPWEHRRWRNGICRSRAMINELQKELRLPGKDEQ